MDQHCANCIGELFMTKKFQLVLTSVAILALHKYTYLVD